MYNTAVLLTVVLSIISGLWYVRCAWIGKTDPVLATWILMVVVVSLSMWMYWESPNKSWTKNIGVVSGVLTLSIILMGVVAAKIRYHKLSVSFNRVQRFCMLGGALVVILWFITKSYFWMYILVQVIALIAYVATIIKIWNADHITEPILTWILILLATLCAIYPAYVSNDIYAWIYLFRAIPSTALVVFLITRIKRRMKLKEA